MSSLYLADSQIAHQRVVYQFYNSTGQKQETKIHLKVIRIDIKGWVMNNKHLKILKNVNNVCYFTHR